MIGIRPRTADDLPVLREVLAAQAEASGYPVRWPWSGSTEEFIVRDGEEQGWTAFLKDEPDRPVGHVSVVRVLDDGDDEIATGWMAATGGDRADLACISVLFVDHTCRGAGIGSALLDTATAWIKARGRIPVLDVVSVHEEVIGLYRRRGWRKVGLAHPYWLPEASIVLMVLDGLPPDEGPHEPTDDQARHQAAAAIAAVPSSLPGARRTTEPVRWCAAASMVAAPYSLQRGSLQGRGPHGHASFDTSARAENSTASVCSRIGVNGHVPIADRDDDHAHLRVNYHSNCVAGDGDLALGASAGQVRLRKGLGADRVKLRCAS